MHNVSTIIAALVLSSACFSAEPHSYAQGVESAKKKGKPLVTFRGLPAHAVDGAIVAKVSSVNDHFAEYPARCVIVSRWVDGRHVYEKTIAEGGKVTVDPDALDEVNRQRAERGLAPFIRDELLTIGAQRCADFRAANLIQGHTQNDFSFLPSGANATSAGCAAWEQGSGWGSCCTFDGYTFAGAAAVVGPDGRRYMQLFVR